MLLPALTFSHSLIRINLSDRKGALFIMRRFSCSLLLLVLLCILAISDNAESFSTEIHPVTDAEKVLRGYDAQSESYVYLTFGSYPYEKDGTERPCLWRVLAIENNYAFLLNEYVVDFQPFHSVKEDQPDWPDYDLYTYMNTTMLNEMFSAQEQACLRYTYEFGSLFILNNKEFMTRAYGFRPILTEVEWERECPPTPYAKTLKGAYVHENGNTWYWSRTCRHTAAGGYEHILGYNGHISMAGFTRIGGVRPACYVDCSMLDKVTGTGTKDDPYVFSIVP